MINIIQKYWGTKRKDEVKFQKLPFPVDICFENKIFMAKPFTGEELKKIGK